MFSYAEQGVHRPSDSNLLDGHGTPFRELLIDELAHRVEAHLELARMHGHNPIIPDLAAHCHLLLLPAHSVGLGAERRLAGGSTYGHTERSKPLGGMSTRPSAGIRIPQPLRLEQYWRYGIGLS